MTRILNFKLILKNLFILMVCLKNVLSESVVSLNSQNFEQVTAQYEIIFVNFYADWCRFSRILAPLFEEAYQKILQEVDEPNRVLFAKVDCEPEGELAARFRISKYPTLKVIIHGYTLVVTKREYRGQRSVEAMVDFIKGYLKDPIKKVSTYSEYDAIEENKGAIIGYFSVPPDDSKEYKIMRKVALSLKDDCNFYWVTGEPSVPAAHEGKTDFVVFKPSKYKPGDKDTNFNGKLSSFDELSTWSQGQCIPLVREITFENAEELTEERLPFVILFHKPDDKESIELFTSIVSKELQDETQSVNFLTANGNTFAHPLHHLGKTVKDLPLVAIDSFKHMYLFPQFSDIKVPGKLKKFIGDLHNGKLHREFHLGFDPYAQQEEVKTEPAQTNPPLSSFKNLAPSKNRYTLLKDEL